MGRVLSPKRIESLQKSTKAVELRIKGKSLAAIAKEVGYKNADRAATAIRRHLVSMAVPVADEALKLELERLDVIQAAFDSDMRDANPRAAEVVLKTMDMRSQYLGLNNYEQRMADAAQAQVLLNARTVDQMFNLMQAVFAELGLTEEQLERAPQVMIEMIEKMELASHDGAGES